MPQEPTQLRAHIREQGEELKSKVAEIENRFKNALDWKVWYRKNTALALGSFAAGGFALSLLIPRKPSAESTAFGRFSEGPYRSVETSPRRDSTPTRVRQVFDTTVSAALGLAAERLQDVLSQALPGFREHYAEAKRRRGE
jgi:hypothetical protein